MLSWLHGGVAMTLPAGRCAALLSALALGCSSTIEYGSAGGGAAWTNVTANLAGLGSECGNMTLLSARPDRDVVIAGVAQRGLWVSANGATAWSPLGQATGSAVITNRPSSIVYDRAHPATFWESGLYNGGGVYRTDDDGATFSRLGTATNIELVGVDFTDPARRTLLAGGHESAHLFRSTDGGGTWVDIAAQLPATAGATSYPLVLDAQACLLGTALSTGAGIFSSGNGGTSWTLVSATEVRSRPLVASDGAIYWPLANGALVRSSDHGSSWTKVTAAGTLTPTTGGLIELPDGRFAAITSGYVGLSSDRGATWKRTGQPLPYSPSGLIYSSFRKAFYVWRFDCLAGADPVPADAIMRMAFE